MRRTWQLINFAFLLGHLTIFSQRRARHRNMRHKGAVQLEDNLWLHAVYVSQLCGRRAFSWYGVQK